MPAEMVDRQLVEGTEVDSLEDVGAELLHQTFAHFVRGVAGEGDGTYPELSIGLQDDADLRDDRLGLSRTWPGDGKHIAEAMGHTVLGRIEAHGLSRLRLIFDGRRRLGRTSVLRRTSRFGLCGGCLSGSGTGRRGGGAGLLVRLPRVELLVRLELDVTSEVRDGADALAHLELFAVAIAGGDEAVQVGGPEQQHVLVGDAEQLDVVLCVRRDVEQILPQDAREFSLRIDCVGLEQLPELLFQVVDVGDRFADLLAEQLVDFIAGGRVVSRQRARRVDREVQVLVQERVVTPDERLDSNNLSIQHLYG